MNFNSLQYLLFLPVTLCLYFVLPQKLKNPVLLIASFFFYGCWEPVYTLLMLLSIVVTYACGLLVSRSEGKTKKLWLVLCLVINLGILFFFKYFNFFSDTAGLLVGKELPTLNVLLPVGISFYTFQALGYTIDVYRGDIPAEKNFIDYALFVSFFPQLVAGPIERTGNIVPQLKTTHRLKFENIKSGMLLILWGLFKKMVIADNLATMVNHIYNAPYDKNGLQLLLATLGFAFQIYCDFSAYSDIARGSAKLLDIELMKNFDFPYGARSIKDFWRRWHISLSTWFKDYLYFPLGGSRVKKWRHLVNLLIVFVVSGLWHGAAMTFVLWGLMHGAYQVIGILLTPIREKFYQKVLAKDHPVMKFVSWVGTFALVNLAWVLFRANSLKDARFILGGIFTRSWSSIGDIGISTAMLIAMALAVILLVAVDKLNRQKSLDKFINKTLWLRYAVWFLLIAAILIFGYYGDGFDPQDFVYFQF